MAWWCAVVAVHAWAEEPQPREDRPLAIPVTEAPPATRTPDRPGQSSDADGRPLALPAHAARQARAPGESAQASWAAADRAARVYARRSLEVRPVVEGTVGGWSPGWGLGPVGGWAGVPVVEVRHGWAVFEGAHRLDVPTTLDKLGETPQRVELQRRIRRARTASGVWHGVGAAGLATGVVGVLGLQGARSYSEARAWSSIASTGSLVGVGGLIVAAFPASRSRRLLVDPSLTLKREEVERRVDTVNEALAVELGVPASRSSK